MPALLDGSLKGFEPHQLTAEELPRRLQVDPVQGLLTEEARRRLAEQGPNELTERSARTPWVILWEQRSERSVGPDAGSQQHRQLLLFREDASHLERRGSRTTQAFELVQPFLWRCASPKVRRSIKHRPNRRGVLACPVREMSFAEVNETPDGASPGPSPAARGKALAPASSSGRPFLVTIGYRPLPAALKATELTLLPLVPGPRRPGVGALHPRVQTQFACPSPHTRSAASQTASGAVSVHRSERPTGRVRRTGSGSATRHLWEPIDHPEFRPSETPTPASETDRLPQKRESIFHTAGRFGPASRLRDDSSTAADS